MFISTPPGQLPFWSYIIIVLDFCLFLYTLDTTTTHKEAACFCV